MTSASRGPAPGRWAPRGVRGFRRAHRFARRVSRCAFAGAVGMTTALSAGAQQPAQRIDFQLVVSHLSHRPGPVDPEFADLYRRLRSDFRFESLQVLERRRLQLVLEQTGGIDLPNGKRVSIRPMHLGDRGILVAVDIDRDVQMDLRVPNRREVVLGTDRYRDGKLLITLRPDY